MRKVVLVVWLCLICAGMYAMVWYNELVYKLPTPIPEAYKPVAVGEQLDVYQQYSAQGKPLFLHFFNPDCPCSRFNMKHFRSLVKQYGNQIHFAMVVIDGDSSYTARDIQDKFHLEIPVYFNAELAATCGVYSTPQAAIINTGGQLYYRGNYNKSRYCTNKETNYAQIALDSLLLKKHTPALDQFAWKAYGCELPTCTKSTTDGRR